MSPITYCLIAYAVISIITFFLYGIDKWKARHRKWRIKESVLLGFAFFGGAAGAILGMAIFRHKTKHWYFRVVAFLGAAWQIALPLVLHFYVGV